ncbi:MAG: 4-hydroxy-3-methylbut-2-enyl diphosphate reductase [Bacteroidales bacterium]
MTGKGRLRLKTEIDDRSGFCFGVVKAIKKAEELLDQGEEVYCVGQIVHNEEEVNRLKKKGLTTISHKDLPKFKHKNILFRAHGEPPERYSKAREHDNHIVDASCPIILKLQRDIRKAHENGENIFIFGKHNHPEVIGLNGQSGNQAVVFDSLEELRKKDIPGRLTLFSQTTMSLDEYHKVVDYLKNRGSEVKVWDSICRQVSGRREEIEQFCRTHDKIIFVAGRHSSNGKVLYNICKQQNPHAHFVSSANEVRSDWFSEEESVGICGATSTPQWLLEQVKETLDAL